ncbi:hypothetical protein B0H13DRAFT_1899100 [Mycena leptocephala]|nr:hypothetical protein B0H13DRAFT_1899100 [Mycena leptocephala]
MTSQPDSSGDEELNEELDADNPTVADTTSENEFVPPRRVLLPQDEYDRLRREGRCFNCKARGHLSRDCPGENFEDTVDVGAARFMDEDEIPEESSNEMSMNVDRQDCNTDRGNLSESGDEFSDEYSDSSEEYYVGVMKILTKSCQNGGLDSEGGCSTGDRHRFRVGVVEEQYQMQKANGRRLVRTSLEGRM